MAPSDKKSGGSPQAATAKKPAGAKTGVGESAPAGKRKPAGPPPGFAVAAAPAPAHETTGAKTGRKSSTGGSRRSSEARRTSLGHQSGSPQVIGENAASASGTPRLLICLFGPPCSGKGTLAALMKEQLRVAHFSTGELLRQAATQEGENSEVGAALKAGKLVEDRVIVRVLKEAMEKNPQERGAILDGFPRNESQVDMLREMNLWPGKRAEQPAGYNTYFRLGLALLALRNDSVGGAVAVGSVSVLRPLGVGLHSTISVSSTSASG